MKKEWSKDEMDAMAYKFMSERKERNRLEKLKQYTYIAVDTGCGLFKIGWSYYPEQRVYAMKTGNANIYLIAIRKGNIENILHKEFSGRRVKREWFTLERSLVNKIIQEYDFKRIKLPRPLNKENL